MAAIETRLQTISGLRTAPFVPNQVNPPQAVVPVPSIPNYHGAFAHGSMVFDISIWVLVSSASDRAGQTALALYMSPSGAQSVHLAIEADKTLGGTVSDCIVKSYRTLGNDEVGAIGYYGGEFILQVVAQGA